MALGERFRGTGSGDVAAFLAGHQDCDEGFDVARDQGPGSGQLKITCKGCGRSVEYRSADTAEMAAGPVFENGEPSSTGDERGGAAPRLSPRPGPSGPPPARSLGARRSPAGLPRWLPNLLIAVVIVAGIGLIVAGLLRSGDGSDAEQGTTPSTAAPEQTEPAPAPAAPEPPLRLKRHVFIGRFTMRVPRGWSRESPGGNVALIAPGGGAAIHVYSDTPGQDPAALAGPTAQFLADEHPGAEVSKPHRVRFGGGSAIQLRAVYDGGEEVAAVISTAVVSFLVTYRKQDGAADRVVRGGDACFASFRPL